MADIPQVPNYPPPNIFSDNPVASDQDNDNCATWYPTITLFSNAGMEIEDGKITNFGRQIVLSEETMNKSSGESMASQRYTRGGSITNYDHHSPMEPSTNLPNDQTLTHRVKPDVDAADMDTQEFSDCSSITSSCLDHMTNDFPACVDLKNPPLKMSSSCKIVENEVSLKRGAFFHLRFSGFFDDISVRAFIGYSHSRPPLSPIQSSIDDWNKHIKDCPLHKFDTNRKFLCSDIPNFLSETKDADFRPIADLTLNKYPKKRVHFKDSGYVTLTAICYNSHPIHKPHGEKSTLIVHVIHKEGQIGETRKSFEFTIACRGSPCRDFPAGGQSTKRNSQLRGTKDKNKLSKKRPRTSSSTTYSNTVIKSENKILLRKTLDNNNREDFKEYKNLEDFKEYKNLEDFKEYKNLEDLKECKTLPEFNLDEINDAIIDTNLIATLPNNSVPFHNVNGIASSFDSSSNGLHLAPSYNNIAPHIIQTEAIIDAAVLQKIMECCRSLKVKYTLMKTVEPTVRLNSQM